MAEELKITRDELKRLLGMLKSCSGDYSLAEEIDTALIRGIAERNDLTFTDASDSVWNTEKICVDK